MFLITQVDEDDGRITIPVQTRSMLENLRERFDSSSGVVSLQGRRFKLAASETLAGIPEANLWEAFSELTPPCTICLMADEPVNCGNDHVVAVNLTRPVPTPPRPDVVEAAVSSVCAKYRAAAQVKITHFLGGPCEEDELMACIVLGGGGQGWTVVKDLRAALELAHSRAVKRFEAQGEISGGQTVRLSGLRAVPELNGQVGIALRFVESSGRWLVRLCNGEGKQLKPVNLEALEGEGGRVLAVWGDARWSRAQLLGEIAKGDWGLCRANIGDLAAGHEERWKNTQGRLAFAPITEMSESYMREAQLQMVAARATAQMHSTEQREGEDSDE